MLGSGLDFMFISYGKSLDGEVDLKKKERLWQASILRYVYVMIQQLTSDGNAIIQLTQTTTTFTLELVYILYHIFEEVILIKPMPSLPHTDEKFLILNKFKILEEEEDQDLKLKILNALEQAILKYDVETCLNPNFIDFENSLEKDYEFNDWFYMAN